MIPIFFFFLMSVVASASDVAHSLWSSVRRSRSTRRISGRWLVRKWESLPKWVSEFPISSLSWCISSNLDTFFFLIGLRTVCQGAFQERLTTTPLTKWRYRYLFLSIFFMNLAFSPPDFLQFQSDASFIGGRWRSLILPGRWSWCDLDLFLFQSYSWISLICAMNTCASCFFLRSCFFPSQGVVLSVFIW